MASGSLLSHINHWVAQGNRFMVFSVKEYFQMDPSFKIKNFSANLPYFAPITTHSVASQKNT